MVAGAQNQNTRRDAKQAACDLCGVTFARGDLRAMRMVFYDPYSVPVTGSAVVGMACLECRWMMRVMGARRGGKRLRAALREVCDEWRASGTVPRRPSGKKKGAPDDAEK